MKFCKLTEEQKEKIKTDYQSNIGSVELSKIYNVHHKAILRWLKKSGVKIRHRGFRVHVEKPPKPIYTPNPEDIETVFKVEPPLFEIEGGFGYQGVVLRDRATDKLQCHICGEWFSSLQCHIPQRHKIKVKDYKKLYGLPRRFPLLSRNISKKLSENTIERIKNGTLKPIPHKKGEKWSKRDIKARGNYRKMDFFLNQKGLCDYGQIERRFLIVSDIVGREPTTSYIIKYDDKLRNAIYTRFGSLNKFREKMGFNPHYHIKWTESKLIAEIRKKEKELHRLPTRRDFIHPTKSTPSIHNTILSHFGSWNRALHCAGFQR